MRVALGPRVLRTETAAAAGARRCCRRCGEICDERRSRCAALAACVAIARGVARAADPRDADRAAPTRYAYVVLGEEGRAVARAITPAPTCPPIDLDGVAQPMDVRARPGDDSVAADAQRARGVEAVGVSGARSARSRFPPA